MASPTERSCESEDDEGGEWELDLYFSDEDDETPRTPTIDGVPRVVDYSVRVPGDWVLSGPLPGWNFRGRRFGSQAEAYQWAIRKFGVARVSNHFGGVGRWALVIKPTRPG